ncbi:MAG: hypothetical protein ACI9R3_001079 [Verrucomicrobiales bacterium]|jgi:hypothetical protein
MWRAVVSQPMNRESKLPALGDIDKEAGEFWVENPFMMPVLGENLSAFERNRTFLNIDGSSFIDVSFASAADIDSDSRSVVAADFDRDGATDLLVGSVGGGPLRLFLNRYPTGNQVRVQLVGTKNNRPGIGARLTASIGARQVVRDVFPPNGFMGQGPTDTTIGMGDAKSIQSLNVRWPNGELQTFKNLPAGKTVTLTEGQSDYHVQ